MTPLLCACAVVITLETQNCRRRHLTSSNLTFLQIVIDKNGFRRMKRQKNSNQGGPALKLTWHVNVSYVQCKTFLRYFKNCTVYPCKITKLMLTSDLGLNPQRQGASLKLICREGCGMISVEITATFKKPVLPGAPRMDNPTSFSFALKFRTEAAFFWLVLRSCGGESVAIDLGLVTWPIKDGKKPYI